MLFLDSIRVHGLYGQNKEKLFSKTRSTYFIVKTEFL